MESLETEPQVYQDRLTPARGGRQMMCEMMIPATTAAGKASAIRMRQLFLDWELPWNHPAEDFCYALREAAMNAARHGARFDDSKSIRILLFYCPACRTLLCEISDPGPGFDPTTPFRAETFEGLTFHVCGRWWMQRGCDSLTYERRGDWWVTRMVKRFGRD